MKKVYFFYSINFLAAFLLFQIELIIAKVLLPEFGGSYLVWSSCIVFFQFFLLLGYLYSHLVIQKIGVYRYRIFHLALIFAPLLTFPGSPLQKILPNNHLFLAADVFLNLLMSIGLVFFVLSTISIFSQSWLAESNLSERVNPYPLYAISNIGSFLALITYPFLYEYYFDLDIQLRIWRIVYFVFLAVYLIASVKIKCNKPVPHIGRVFDQQTVSLKQVNFEELRRTKLYWFLLAAAPVIVFLSVTNIISYEVAPCPLLWIIPLSIYLLSFALNFKQNPWRPLWINNKIHYILGFSAALFFITLRIRFPFFFIALAYFIFLFAVCMFCQSELYITRPKEKDGLTGFYVIIALGGFLGSMFVTWLAPVIFINSELEYLAGLLIISLALLIKNKAPVIKIPELRWIIYLVLIVILWPRVFLGYNLIGIIILYFVFKWVYKKIKDNSQLLTISLFSLLLAGVFNNGVWKTAGQQIYMLRNYYGMYNVVAEGNLVNFYSGTTLHGAQSIFREKMKEPLAYFHRNTPVGEVMESAFFNFQRIGIVGLGAGTLSAYGKQGQEIDFFELDPDVYKIADICFTYLADSAAKINYIFGDARIELVKSPVNYYDILIMDAFSSDSVPAHLLTTDAINEYKKHLKKEGVILFHISNRYLNFIPVLFSDAQKMNAYVSFKFNPVMNIKEAAMLSEWIAMTWDKNKADILTLKLGWRPDSDFINMKKVIPWSDNYTTIISIFKLHDLFNQIKSFNYLDCELGLWSTRLRSLLSKP